MSATSRRDGAFRARSSQSGAVLAIALILLLVMTLLAVASLRGTLLESRMAASQRDRSLEFQTAEAALRSAEQAINADTTNALGQNCLGASQTGCGLPDDAGVVANCSGCWVTATVTRPDKSVGSPQYLIQRFDSLSSAQAYGLGNSAATTNYGGVPTSFTARAYYRVFARSHDPASGAGRALVLLTANYSVPLPGAE